MKLTQNAAVVVFLPCLVLCLSCFVLCCCVSFSCPVFSWLVSSCVVVLCHLIMSRLFLCYVVCLVLRCLGLRVRVKVKGLEAQAAISRPEGQCLAITDVIY
jgi:hypothetical protein